MAYTKVTSDQFVFLGDFKVCHRLTGASFWTSQYLRPGRAGPQLGEHPGLTGTRLFHGDFDLKEVRTVAIQMLRERARPRA